MRQDPRIPDPRSRGRRAARAGAARRGVAEQRHRARRDHRGCESAARCEHRCDARRDRSKGDTPTFRQFDLTIAKDVPLGGGQFTVRLDVINLFNTTNYKGWDDWAGGPGTANFLGGDNAHLGVPNDIAGPMRTLKLSMRYAF